MAVVRKMLAVLMILVMVCVAFPCLAEETFDVVDEVETVEDVQQEPVEAAELEVNANLLALATSAAPLTSTYEPEDLVKLVSRRNDEKGNNENHGVYTVSSSSIQLRQEAAQALVNLCNDAEDDGMTLYVRQGYRSYADEASRYARMEKRGEIGQKPGENDYQTGLAVTLVSKAWRAKTLTADFGATKEAEWIASNAARYGFVLRYPQGKQDITGWEWEPWHLRYVGVSVAEYMQQNNLCLEEFLLEKGMDGVIDMPAEAEVVPEIPQTGKSHKRSTEKVTFTMPEYLPDGETILDEQGPDGDYEISLFHD